MTPLQSSKTLLISILTAGTFVLFPAAFSQANETQDLKNQVQALQQRIDQLEKQLAAQPQQAPVQQRPMIHRPRTIDLFDDWDPFQSMRLMQHQMGQMMNDPIIDFNPRQDIKETPEAYVISMDLPGMDKDKINVEVKQGMLIVSGERKSETKEEKPNQAYMTARSFGRFYRSMALPEDAKADAIDAKYENGVLTVKVARTKPDPKSKEGQKIKVK
jgi:HSP20 family protein